MKIPKRLEKTSENVLSKKQIKSIIALLNKYHYNEEHENLKIIKCKDKVSLISSENQILLFSIGKSEFLPHLRLVDENTPFKVAYLDGGAKKPLLSGADVMLPGIFKYIDKIEPWDKGEYVIVKVEDEIFGIGITTCNSNEITKDSHGTGIEMIHVKDDSLFNFSL